MKLRSPAQVAADNQDVDNLQLMTHRSTSTGMDSREKGMARAVSARDCEIIDWALSRLGEMHTCIAETNRGGYASAMAELIAALRKGE